MVRTSLWFQQLHFAYHRLIIHFSNKTQFISKVTQLQHIKLDQRGVNNFFGLRYQQNSPALTSMEQLDFAPESSNISNLEMVTPTVTNELAETGKAKRKSEETDESEKSGRGKRKRGGGGKKLRPGERYIPPPQRRNPGISFSKEHFDETTYYFEGGLRKVHPYYYDFKTYCKGRWIGKSLLEVFSSEFRSESIDYYKRAAKQGRIRLNDTTVEDLSIILRNNDLMRNTVHRHEPPVVGRPLDVLVDNGEVLVVNKPASIPVHPCGRFRHNTVIFILGKELGVSELHTVHRLDRLTSGVLLFARTLEMSKKLDQLVRERQLEKEYVCRVDGEFPEEELVCEEPILVVSFKVGLCRVDSKGKDCRTVFQRMSFNGRSSVVRCLPLTGRTHQIRVHLQYLGFPILNDPIYGSTAWGPHRGRGGQVGKSDEDLLKALVEEHRLKESLHLLDLPDDEIAVVQAEGPLGAEVSGKEQESGEVADDTKSDDKTGENSQTQKGAVGTQESKTTVKEVNREIKPTQKLNTYGDSAPQPKCSVPCEELGNHTENNPQRSPPSKRDHLCSECKLVRPDPTEKDLIMYLHALRYKGPDFEYSTHLPEWAKEDWVED